MRAPRLHRCLILVSILGATPAVGQGPAAERAATPEPTAPAVAFLVRHAEKQPAGGDDPGLTTPGRARALALAGRLAEAGIARVLATDTVRARQTAAPVAERLGLEVELYDAEQLGALAAELRRRGQPVLVVGHSNTTHRLVTELGGEPGAPIEDPEYDRLYRVDLATGATEIVRFDPTMADLLAATGPADWRPLDPENTLYLELAGGRVVIELAPDLAPRHVANVKKLARQRYFDGLAILRSQDNYVVQWGDPAAGEEGARPLGEAEASLAAELDRAVAPDLPFTPLPDGDVYAPQAGFTHGFPAARDPQAGRTWLAHCYGMLGAGRGNTADSGNGAQLYVVIGHSPRHLDRNVTLLGRVVQGMELLSTLPRGTGPLGFYAEPAQHVPIRSLRVAADLPAAQRTELELLRTDTATFAALVEARRHRREEWFLDPVGRIELCNVPLPVRPLQRTAATP